MATVTIAQYADVERNLKRRGFTHHDAARSWHTSLPRWLRWPSATVTGTTIGDDLIALKGLRLFLKNLLPLSSTRLFVTPLW